MTLGKCHFLRTSGVYTYICSVCVGFVKTSADLDSLLMRDKKPGGDVSWSRLRLWLRSWRVLKERAIKRETDSFLTARARPLASRHSAIGCRVGVSRVFECMGNVSGVVGRNGRGRK